MVYVADLYIRVSTDEQADKGYSQRNQEEMLRKYCINNSIQIRNVIYEDHSAKSFNRPAWKQLIQSFKKKKHGVNLVLFTKWDRFSRNAGDAYQMISMLRGFGVEPQAIEQPLDLSIPENKMMLAFYLAAPEVENDRRSLNVFYGMRRARKEGRFMGMAPIGYANKVYENGLKYIARKEPEASIVNWAFKEIAKRVFNTEQIWKSARNKGLKCSENSFWWIIRNPIYCGKIFIPQHKDEESYFVVGKHEPIISEALFYEVQDVLDGRGRTYRPKIETHDEFLLRGFLICPECERLLTGSRSKGRNRHYSYYHCGKGCKHRISADIVNSKILEEIEHFIPDIEDISMYQNIIYNQYADQPQKVCVENKVILAQIKDYEDRLSHMRDLLSTQQIEASDYREAKSDYTAKIASLEAQLSGSNNEIKNVQNTIMKGVRNIVEIKNQLKSKSLNNLRMAIGSIYPEKFVFEGAKVRTGRKNEFIECINGSYRKFGG